MNKTNKCWVLSPQQLCDVELLGNSAFSPLTGFLTQKDYDCVLSNMRLKNGALWPIPITLDVTHTFADSIAQHDVITLHDPEGNTLGTLTVSDIWEPNKIIEAEQVFGTADETHPGVRALMQNNPVYVGGAITCAQTPKHYDFMELRHTPKQLNMFFAQNNWDQVIAFQTRNPMHRAHQVLTLMAAEEYNAKLLIHPVSGLTKPGDIDYFVRIRCYREILKTYPKNSAFLSLLPLAMRMAGPREALWHALIRKNYGCTHFIVGRDHAGPGVNKNGVPFYDPYSAQTLVSQHEKEMGIKMIPFQEVVYDRSQKKYVTANQVKDKNNIAQISGTEFRHLLQTGADIPEWFSYSGVIRELRKSYPPKHQQGFTLFFTGLSGAGKSTIANALIQKLHEHCETRAISLLDGDVVRRMLSSGLGFSKADRALNIQRIAYVASEITKHRGIAICAQIAPHESARQEARALIESYGGFFEIYISTSLSTCKQRDPKGLYQKALRGEIKQFTGVDDAYEAPKKPDVIIDTDKISVDAASTLILQALQHTGFLQKPAFVAPKTEKMVVRT